MGINARLNHYIAEVDAAVKTLIELLHYYNTNCRIEGYKSYCSKLKVHLTKNIRRLGPALNYETEKGKQFKKYIWENLFFTNRTDISRDIGCKTNITREKEKKKPKETKRKEERQQQEIKENILTSLLPQKRSFQGMHTYSHEYFCYTTHYSKSIMLFALKRNYRPKF